MPSRCGNDEVKIFDVCIIGAGPAALSCLSAIQEPYSLDNLNDGQVHRAVNRLSCDCKGPKTRSVAVIDPHGKWMEGWKRQFQALGIQYLRSPALAHPDMFDQNTLMAFAEEQGRQNELIESGCGDLKSLLPLGQSQIGLWKLPTLGLFTDFCQRLSQRLSHTLVHGTAVDVTMTNANEEASRGKGEYYEVTLENGETVLTEAVILALGSVGKPIIPMELKSVEDRFLIPWMQLNTLPNTSAGEPPLRNVLVIGGGLTAVQAAQSALSKGTQSVTLCSRRPLVERHFDIDVKWFDRRTTTMCMAEFYHLSHEKRLGMLKDCRGGGSVPAVYMKDVRHLEAGGRLRRVVGNAKYTDTLSNGDDREQVLMEINDTIESYDSIIVACGLQPDCESNELCRNMLKKWPLPVIGGFPCVSEDLEWNKNLFVVGGLSSLSVGPDAANLMGMRRSAQIVANTLGCRCWLREANVLKNPFDALMTDDTESESEDEPSAACSISEKM